MEKDSTVALFETLDQICEIATPRASIWSVSDKYARVPFLVFKFKDHHLKHKLYESLADTISKFNGNFAWKMGRLNRPESPYLIAPSIYFERLLQAKPNFFREQFLNEMSIDEYQKMFDSVVDDIPILIEFIKSSQRN